MRRFKDLEPKDFRVLLAIEAGMEKYEFVPLETAVGYSNLPREEALYRIRRVHKLSLVRGTATPYVGYSLTYPAYDFLALNVFVKSDRIAAMGSSLGLGKEADVYDALTPGGKKVAVKFHRLGRVSFRQTRRVRGYTPRKTLWLFQSRLAAEREYAALRKMFACKVSVPRPIAQNRHAILMGKIEGVELARCKTLPNPKETLLRILGNVKKAYGKARIIHADLSKYNVLVEPGGSVQVIDWPQYVTVDHPNAEALLERDVRNVTEHFAKTFNVAMPVADALNFVKQRRWSVKGERCS